MNTVTLDYVPPAGTPVVVDPSYGNEIRPITYEVRIGTPIKGMRRGRIRYLFWSGDDPRVHTGNMAQYDPVTLIFRFTDGAVKYETAEPPDNWGYGWEYLQQGRVIQLDMPETADTLESFDVIFDYDDMIGSVANMPYGIYFMMFEPDGARDFWTGYRKCAEFTT